MTYPRMMRIRQTFEDVTVDDLAGTTQEQLQRLKLSEKVREGESVAITAGSRGIANLSVIVKAIVDHVRSLGAVPFIVPAMGSHGGGTAEGQRAIVEGYGITAESMDCEIRSSMETVIVGETPHGIPVHFDKHAYEADHVIVCNRVKPHTGFVGEIESGLHKMMLIGLGKHAGASIYHRAIKNHSFGEIIRAVADSVLTKCGILCGVAIVENGYDETALIEAVAPQQFYEREKELLVKAKNWMPKLPFPQADLLIVDRIGKNISGTGLDTNVVGRKYNDHVATEHDDVSCTRIFVRGLTEETHGNATGIGMSEFTNKRTIDQIDQHITAINCLTGGHPTAAMLPISFEADRDAIKAALETVGLIPPEQVKVIQIADTLHL
ncbi:MAG TPA: lactate racemase domain-containing protein, partial [Planctomycetaceae bacterium]|nr:lactate racemase domain-containing protein [Planctomycetaceae bacterium]